MTDRCPMPCDRTCISCAERPPVFDVSGVGPLCGPCTANGQGEPNTEQATDHRHDEDPGAEPWVLAETAPYGPGLGE
jgi:hypothetical protein